MNFFARAILSITLLLYLQTTSAMPGSPPCPNIEIEGHTVHLMEQLSEEIIDTVIGLEVFNIEVVPKISQIISDAPFEPQIILLGKAREGVGGFQLKLISESLDSTSHQLVVDGMPPWP